MLTTLHALPFARARRSPRIGRRSLHGATLIEALVAILVFVVGLLGLVKMQAYSVTTSRDATYRAEASVLAHEIIGIMWTDRTNLSAYQHRATSTGCDVISGSNATSNNASNWLAEFTTASNARYLPGATADRQQIVVDTSVTPPIARVRLCWRSPQDGGYRNFVAVSQLP